MQFLICSCLILKHRGVLCGPVSEGYESRTIPGEYKDDRESRRNQQVYSASPVKTVDKCNDSGNFSELNYEETTFRIARSTCKLCFVFVIKNYTETKYKT